MIGTVETKLNGAQKASILMMALGTVKSAEVFKCLTEDEIEVVVTEMARLSDVWQEDKEAVLAEFEFMRASLRHI